MRALTHHDARYGVTMRTTIALDPDIEAEVERLRREEGLGLSEAVNVLARRGLVTTKQTDPYAMSPRPMGAKIDVDNIGEVLDLLDEP
jgi:hypothetical protein